MADRLIKVLENGRLLTRGLANLEGAVQAYVGKDEALTFTVDWSNWLGARTIASVANEVHGPTLTASNTTTTASLTVSRAPGTIYHRITDSDGQTKELRIHVRSPDQSAVRDYGCM